MKKKTLSGISGKEKVKLDSTIEIRRNI